MLLSKQLLWHFLEAALSAGFPICTRLIWRLLGDWLLAVLQLDLSGYYRPVSVN
ncbi:hypothetical protein [Nostoc sp. DedSLP04]|uniref:hypothetical protein n=1 Tax=Nostoc sp. DedSLP04 TaxID=3075401 RepID=UPI002AD5370B|nr:hypothetical protein [Nostoc sp. DedSLP04]MDZ8034496.1 hypothetical protein [Nostoc sp. DedSLP04]